MGNFKERAGTIPRVTLTRLIYRFRLRLSPPVRGKYGLKKGLRDKKDFVYGLKKSVRGFFNPNLATLGRKGSP